LGIGGEVGTEIEMGMMVHGGAWWCMVQGAGCRVQGAGPGPHTGTISFSPRRSQEPGAIAPLVVQAGDWIGIERSLCRQAIPAQELVIIGLCTALRCFALRQSAMLQPHALQDDSDYGQSRGGYDLL